jgi:hypothetical protein
MLTRIIHSIVFFSLSVLLWYNSGCAKEYSYERQDTAPPVQDSTSTSPIPQPSPDFPLCAACADKDNYEEDRWSFKAGNSFLCGIIDTAIVNIERNAFTFFGPSACSSDTNMVISVYLESQKLDRSQQNIVIPKVFFYFSAAGSPQFVLVSRSGTPFTVILKTYDHQTKMTTGSFSGYVFKADGTTILIDSTKFKLKLI